VEVIEMKSNMPTEMGIYTEQNTKLNNKRFAGYISTKITPFMKSLTFDKQKKYLYLVYENGVCLNPIAEGYENRIHDHSIPDEHKYEPTKLLREHKIELESQKNVTVVRVSREENVGKKSLLRDIGANEAFPNTKCIVVTDKSCNDFIRIDIDAPNPTEWRAAVDHIVSVLRMRGMRGEHKECLYGDSIKKIKLQEKVNNIKVTK